MEHSNAQLNEFVKICAKMTSTSTAESKGSGELLENPLSNLPQPVRWVQTFELGYDEPEAPPSLTCFGGCGQQQEPENANVKFAKCSKCHVAAYCSRDCQVRDWKNGGHKMSCPSYARLATIHEDATKEQVRNQVFSRIRFYACPYAVHKASELGNGFLFIQSDTTLKDLSITIPKDPYGRAMPVRSIMMHYLTLGEFDAEVCRDDFEMAAARTKLQEISKDYDEQSEVVILMRLRCGHVAVGKATLVPDYLICKKLGQDYYADNAAGAIQLTLDDL